MIAAAFIDFNIGNIFMIIGGVLLFLLCIGAEILFAKDGGGNYQGAFALFSLFFLIGLGIVFPHMSSVNHRHHAQVFADLPREYGPGLTVIDNSVQDHWVEFKFRQCGPQVYRYGNMRLIKGHYWFATTVVENKNGQDSNVYRPIPSSNLSGICQTAMLVSN